MDCRTKQSKITHYFAYKYMSIIFSVFDYTCANDENLYLKQVKDDPPRNPQTVFRVRIRALFEWQNRLKVAFSFVFALDAFAFALCINGPLRARSVVHFVSVKLDLFAYV